MMLKKLVPFFITMIGLTISVNDTLAQTTRKVVVEHFTNTRCSVCGSRNPGLYNNLNTAKDVLHIAYHPSRPYSSCVLNQHNVAGNDDRTKFYNVYGSTPRVVVQGVVKSAGDNYNSSSLYSGEQNQMTPVEIRLTTIKKGMDSLVVKIVITAAEDNSLTNMNLFAVAAEDTVFYNAPNGEKEHFDVFRKVLLDIPVSTPQTKGDSVVYYARAANDGDWNASRMFVMAMVQGEDKKIEQVESTKGDADVTGGTSVVDDAITLNIEIYPNPANKVLNINSAEVSSVVLMNMNGEVIMESNATQNHKLNVTTISPGLYYAVLQTSSSQVVRKVAID